MYHRITYNIFNKEVTLLEKINLKTPKINSCQAIYSNYNDPILLAYKNYEFIKISLFIGLSDGKFS